MVFLMPSIFIISTGNILPFSIPEKETAKRPVNRAFTNAVTRGNLQEVALNRSVVNELPFQFSEEVEVVAAELAAATTIVIASGTGIPISTTHTLVGAVLGVGMARGIEAIDLRIVARIFVSWVVTIPAGAILAIIFFFGFRAFLP